MQPSRAPALQTGDLRGDVVAACFLDVHQRAAGARDGELQVSAASAAPDAPAINAATTCLVFRRRDDVRPSFHEREHAAADEVHLEAEEIVLIARDRRQRVNARIDVKKSPDEATDVRRHRDEQV